jgi:hypothetical protein
MKKKKSSSSDTMTIKTCLHVALMRQSVPQEREPTPMLEAVSF